MLAIVRVDFLFNGTKGHIQDIFDPLPYSGRILNSHILLKNLELQLKPS